jgi:hypothetical protein
MIDEYEAIFPEASTLQDTAASLQPTGSIRVSQEIIPTKIHEEPPKQVPQTLSSTPANETPNKDMNEDLEMKMKEHRHNLQHFIENQEVQWREIARTMNATEQVTVNFTLF